MEYIIKEFFTGIFKCFWIFIAAILGILYILSPLDVIPDVIPIFGWIDDLGVAGWLIHKLAGAFYRHIALWVLIIPGFVYAVIRLISNYVFSLPGWVPAVISLPFFLFGFWKIGNEME